VHVTATDAAVATVRRALDARSGTLSITIGTGCCESTAPFLYEDFWPGPDQEQVGEVAGVPVFAPEYLRQNYAGDDGVVIDVVDVLAESLSIETEWSCRLILRGLGVDTGRDDSCAVEPSPSLDLDDPDRPGARVRGELPDALERMRLR
jgi:uncharacterized protein (DUF779 family)